MAKATPEPEPRATASTPTASMPTAPRPTAAPVVADRKPVAKGVSGKEPAAVSAARQAAKPATRSAAKPASSPTRTEPAAAPGAAPRSNLARAAALETPPAVELSVEKIIWHPKPERRVAVVSIPGESGTRRLGEGAEVAGYTIAKIGVADVELLRDGVSTKRRLGAN